MDRFLAGGFAPLAASGPRDLAAPSGRRFSTESGCRQMHAGTRIVAESGSDGTCIGAFIRRVRGSPAHRFIRGIPLH
ncbi:MAG: hypothetical protein ACRDGA_09500 [Bacteroidota bacterium]